MTLAKAEEKPVETILSGPAASFMGLTALFPTDKDAILLDMGDYYGYLLPGRWGTTFEPLE